jgi:hypothetical protein
MHHLVDAMAATCSTAAAEEACAAGHEAALCCRSPTRRHLQRRPNIWACTPCQGWRLLVLVLQQVFQANLLQTRPSLSP